LAGGEGFEPSTPNLGDKQVYGFQVDQYRVYLNNLYCKSYAKSQLNNATKHFDCLKNPSKLLSLKTGMRLNVLKAMVCLSKYSGCYEEYKTKLKNYGIKWVNEDTAFNGFLAIFNHKHDTLPDWIKQVQPLFHDNEKLFLRFLAVTGLRKNEALTSFNMIIELNSKGKLCEYYNEDFSTLEHFKYGKLFLRGTKNAFISIVPKAMITEITNSQPVSYNAIHCRLMRKNIPLRFKELRSYQNSYLRKNGLISELVDIIAGRVPKSVFTRHYLGQDMKAFGTAVLEIEYNLEQTLLTPKMELTTAS
jgi:hypothetical protein